MSGPAGSWAAKLPEGVPRLQEHLSFLRAPIEAVRQFLQQAQGYVSGDSQSTAGASQAPAENARCRICVALLCLLIHVLGL